MSSSSAPTDTADLLTEAEQLVELGLERYGRNQTTQAIRCWERALELDPSNARALDYLNAAGWTGHSPTPSEIVERLCRRVDQLIEDGDDEVALSKIQAHRDDPAKYAALQTRLEHVRSRLVRRYERAIGDVDALVRYDLELRPRLESDHERRIAALAHGRASAREIIDTCGLDPLDASRALANMIGRGALASHRDNPPATSVATTKGTELPNVQESLREAMKLDGAIAVALVDYDSGMTLGTDGDPNLFNIEVAAAGNTQVVRSKMEVMRQLNIGGGIEDILITLDDQYHLIRLLRGSKLFLYLALNRSRGNLGMARHRLKAIEEGLVI